MLKKKVKTEPLDLKQLYARIVVGCGIAPDYFLDEMDEWEADAALLGLSLKERDPWERTRMSAYIMTQINTTEELKPSDVIRFPWDEKIEIPTLNKEDISTLEQLSQNVECIMNGGV